MASSIKGFEKLAWYFQVLIVAGVCAALLGLVWYQYLSPMQTVIDSKKAELAQLTAQVEKSHMEEQQLAQFKAQADKLKEQLDMLKGVLPQEKETDQILRQAQRSAETSGLRIIRVAPRSTIDHEVYTEWPIDMEVLGTYHNIGSFLDKIRLLPRIVNISGMRIQSRASEGPASLTASVGATYTATTFVYKEEAAEANPPKVTVAK
ncbi:MAG TPA: type 4a pilus biogenesis protein PilO [Terriglobia bacterium]|nr:type 4a pilus biogenesis protein PilO [Terriglobia bacterium]